MEQLLCNVLYLFFINALVNFILSSGCIGSGLVLQCFVKEVAEMRGLRQNNVQKAEQSPACELEAVRCAGYSTGLGIRTVASNFC